MRQNNPNSTVNLNMLFNIPSDENLGEFLFKRGIFFAKINKCAKLRRAFADLYDDIRITTENEIIEEVYNKFEK
jgi:hypothetical protein